MSERILVLGRGVEVAGLLDDSPRRRLTPRLRRSRRALTMGDRSMFLPPEAPRISSETTRRRFASAAVLQGEHVKVLIAHGDAGSRYALREVAR